MSQKPVDARSVGIVGKPHGIKGEVNVMLLTDYPDSITTGSVLYTDAECSLPVTIEGIYFKRSKGRHTAVIKFEGISSRDQALGIRGSQVFRKSSDSPELEEGTYWIDDLEGCTVYAEDGSRKGVVEKVEVLPANENLAVKTGDGDTIIYIPLVDEYISSIEIDKKKIVIKKMPEYL